ncbi:pseudouridine synthase, partial [Dichotomocladium elegans]
NGLRKVKPYYFEHSAYAKARWTGQPLIDIFDTEFQYRDRVYYRHAIETGLITVNRRQVSPDYLVRTQDHIVHCIHRHEPAVTAKPIIILQQQQHDDLLAINKPGGIPVHPGGRYWHNTVTQLLKEQLGVPRLFPVNRLDLPTSGLFFVGLNAERARLLSDEMVRGAVQKEYLCRVDGKFPDGQIICEAPVRMISYRLSVHYVHPDGRPSKTLFERISYDGKTSVVRCRPLTGRTHQIRVHLRYLGFPIANDPLYGNRLPWSYLLMPGQPLSSESAAAVVNTIATSVSYPRFVQKTEIQKEDDCCNECGLVHTPDPPEASLAIYLHAWRYSGKGWAYETEIPDWV